MSLMIFDSIRELIFDKINTKIWWKGNILLIDLGFQNLSSNTSFPHFIDFSSIFEHFTLDWIPHLTLDLISLKERFILFFAFFWIICVHCFALFFILIKSLINFTPRTYLCRDTRRKEGLYNRTRKSINCCINCTV